jgi:UDP-N-acetylmuramate dehydrogenase
VACAKVARFSAARGLAGAEFLAGIPGTVGGALAMNAGAFGGETWSIVRSVETMDRAGRRRRRLPAEFEIGYRQVQGPAGEWFIAAAFELRPDPDRSAAARIRELLAQRAETQPTGVFSCGSVFRNPEGDFAGRLIEACGLKGRRVGRARVSDRHANFIVNEGGATAADIEALVLLVQEEVRTQTGVRLEPEVRIVGRACAREDTHGA